jgi:integrase
MPIIKNERLSEFQKTGLIKFMEKIEFCTLLESGTTNINPTIRNQVRAFFRILWSTGRRPSEIMELVKGNCNPNPNKTLKILFKTRKGGVPTTVFLPANDVTEKVIAYVQTIPFPEMTIFPGIQSANSWVQKIKSKKLDGSELRKYTSSTKRVRYFSMKIFGVPPYFFRHNRFSKVGNIDMITYLKGAKDPRSSMRYRHFDEKEAKRASKYLA